MTAINSNRAIRGPVTAVPVVAGKGVRLVADTENNRWVVEADETVLWEGYTVVSVGGEYILNESPLNFERIAIYASRNPSTTQALIRVEYDISTTKAITFWAPLYTASNTSGSIYIDIFGGEFTASKFTVTGFVRKEILSNSVTSLGNTPLTITKIVGIHRIASA